MGFDFVLLEDLMDKTYSNVKEGMLRGQDIGRRKGPLIITRGKSKVV